MAPYFSPPPDVVIGRLAEPRIEAELPLSMGGPAGPTAQIGVLDGQWCLYHLRCDDAAFMAFADEQQRTGQPLFPEHRMRFLVPGEVLVRADDRKSLMAALAGVEATFDANYRLQLKR
ncbi:MAG: hypothetical protein AAGF11_04465 [Myxococcota bacterium]